MKDYFGFQVKFVLSITNIDENIYWPIQGETWWGVLDSTAVNEGDVYQDCNVGR